MVPAGVDAASADAAGASSAPVPGAAIVSLGPAGGAVVEPQPSSASVKHRPMSRKARSRSNVSRVPALVLPNADTSLVNSRVIGRILDKVRSAEASKGASLGETSLVRQRKELRTQLCVSEAASSLTSQGTQQSLRVDKLVSR